MMFARCLNRETGRLTDRQTERQAGRVLHTEKICKCDMKKIEEMCVEAYTYHLMCLAVFSI